MDIGPLLARSANARDSATATRRDSRDDTGEWARLCTNTTNILALFACRIYLMTPVIWHVFLRSFRVSL